MIDKVAVTTREGTLSLLLRQGELSASSLAASMRISVQAMRRHLRSLEEDGLVESIQIALGPGRPSNLWHLTFEGQKYFNNGKGIEKFALELLSSIESTLTSQSITKVLHKQAFDQANFYRSKIGSGSIRSRLNNFVALRNKEGNKSDFSFSENDSSSFYLNAIDCSIKPIVDKYPIFCDQELQLIRNIFSDCEVNRIQWRLETGKTCGFKITSNA